MSLRLRRSELLKRSKTFHAVEFFGLPVHGEFDHGKAGLGCGEQLRLRIRPQVGARTNPDPIDLGIAALCERSFSRCSVASGFCRRTQFRLELRHGRKAALEFLRQRLNQAGAPLGHTNGLFQVAQGVLDRQPVLPAAEQQTDAGLVVGVP